MYKNDKYLLYKYIYKSVIIILIYHTPGLRLANSFFNIDRTFDMKSKIYNVIYIFTFMNQTLIEQFLINVI